MEARAHKSSPDSGCRVRLVACLLAYAPAEPQTSIERDQLVALTADFGAGIGTFKWNGRSYQYTLVNRLPCFPGPVVVAK